MFRSIWQTQIHGTYFVQTERCFQESYHMRMKSMFCVWITSSLYMNINKKIKLSNSITAFIFHFQLDCLCSENQFNHLLYLLIFSSPLQWRHNQCDGFSNHQPRDCLLNRLFRRRSTKTSKLRVTGLCVGNSPVTGEFPHKLPVTRKMFPFDDVITLWPGIACLRQWAGSALFRALQFQAITYANVDF